MKQIVQWWLFLTCFSQITVAQNKSQKTYRNFPIVVTMQFHALSFPLKDLSSNFKNVGLGIGSEISLGSTHAWAQQFQLIGYRNKQAGNGIVLYTQSAWRPTIAAHVYTELKAGFGVTYNFRPVESYKQIDGQWTSVGHSGKWILTVPVGVSLGYNKYSPNTYVAPFISYQVLANAWYAKSLPIVTNSLFQVGARIHLPAQK
jgi:hypothetical protein